MSKIQKLELTWIGKNEQEEIEPRILIENPELSHVYNTGKSGQMSLTNPDGTFDNMLIHGDNLLALKALEQDFSGKVKCVYIDPPYNTGSAFEHYDDNLEHSIWLNLMKQRLEILHNLLSDNGFIFVQIDDNEQPYLTVLMDEIFGRQNRVNIISVKMSESSGVKMAHVEKKLPKMKEFILLYRKSDVALLNPIKINKENNLDDYLKYYSKIITNFEDNVENWIIADVVDYMKSLNLNTTSEEIKQFKIDNAKRMVYRTNNKSFNNMKIDKKIAEVVSPTGLKYIWWEGKQMLFLSDYITEYLCDLWNDISTINLNKEGIVEFNQSKKPEKLIERVLLLATNKNDLVLDSFLGSGTTCAVAHKMGRKWIGIELGEHCYTRSKIRLDGVIDGEQSGISKAVNWKGGGGYKFYELAPSLVIKDSHGREVINPEYNANMLAAAMAKHEGFTYSPNQSNPYKQGFASEKSFIFTTTNHLTAEYLDEIASNFADDEYLVINCKSFDGNILNNYKNIKIKKIPQSILGKCVFGKDNYNLNIIDLPVEDDDAEE